MSDWGVPRPRAAVLIVCAVAAGALAWTCAPASAASLDPDGLPASSLRDRIGELEHRPAERGFSPADEVGLRVGLDRVRERVDAYEASHTPPETRPGSDPEAALRSSESFGGLDSQAAVTLTRRQFGDVIDGVSATPDLTNVAAFRGAHAAVTKPDALGHREVLLSPMVLGVRGDDGTYRPIELGLRRGSGGWSPVSSPVATTLPSSASGLIQVTDGVAFRVASIQDAQGQLLGDTAAIYPNAREDTDLTTSATPAGVETFFTLRSPGAPEVSTLRFAGDDVALVADHGGVRIQRGGDPVAKVAPPRATDAAGADVPTSMQIVGNEVRISTLHDGKGFQYPILVDPDVVVLSGLPTSVENLADHLGPDGDLASMDPQDRGQWYFSNGGSAQAGLDGTSYGPGLYIDRPAGDDAGGAIWAYVLPSATDVSSIEFGPYASSHGTDDPSLDPVVLASIGTDRETVVVDLFDGSNKQGEVRPERLGGPVQAIAFGLISSAPNEDAHSAFLGSAVLHVGLEDGPTLGTPPTLPATGDFTEGKTLWTNYAGVDYYQPTATNNTTGVKAIGFVAEDSMGNEIPLGEYDDPCDGTLASPCPTTLTPGPNDLPVDYGLLAEGTYRIHAIAVDPYGTRSADLYVRVGIDRTPPKLPEVNASLAKNASGDPVLQVGVPQVDPGDSTVSSGVDATNVTYSEDTGATVDATVNCVTDNCDPPVTVPLHSDVVVDQQVTAKAQDLAGNETSTTVHLTTQAWAPLDQSGGDNDNGTMTGGGSGGGN